MDTSTYILTYIHEYVWAHIHTYILWKESNFLSTYGALILLISFGLLPIFS